MKKQLLLLLGGALAFSGCNTVPSQYLNIQYPSYMNTKYTQEFNDGDMSTWGAANCHDPYLFKDDDGTYYVFSTDASRGNVWKGGILIRKSSDLISWTCLKDPAIPNGYWDPDMLSWCGFRKSGDTENGAKASTASSWAPCVVKVNGKYLMYHGIITDVTIKGAKHPRAWIGLAIADKVTGPYKPANIYDPKTYTTGTVVRYTYSKKLSADDAACFNEGKNGWVHGFGAIDPNVTFDDAGKMWLTYGSWKAGLANVELNPATGMPTAGAPADTVENGFGTRIAGDDKSGPAIEGPAILNAPNSKYYYLFNSNGNLVPDYSVHVSRVLKTDGINGKYKDSKGNSMLNVGWTNFHSQGNKFLGGFQFGKEEGWRAPGGPALLVDGDKIFMAVHCRTNFKPSWYFYLQIHQIYINKDGWPVANPNEYGGEALKDIAGTEMNGNYDAVLSMQDDEFGTFNNYEGSPAPNVNITDAMETKSKAISLTSTNATSGTISGIYKGTWEIEKGDATAKDGTKDLACYITVHLNSSTIKGFTPGTYKGIITEAYDWGRKGDNVVHKTLTISTFSPATGKYFFANLKTF